MIYATRILCGSEKLWRNVPFGQSKHYWNNCWCRSYGFTGIPLVCRYPILTNSFVVLLSQSNNNSLLLYILCYAMLCYAMLCYAMLCYAMLWLGGGPPTVSSVHAWELMFVTNHNSADVACRSLSSSGNVWKNIPRSVRFYSILFYSILFYLFYSILSILFLSYPILAFSFSKYSLPLALFLSFLYLFCRMGLKELNLLSLGMLQMTHIVHPYVPLIGQSP